MRDCLRLGQSPYHAGGHLRKRRKIQHYHCKAESCPTKIFLANPETDRDQYRRWFNLNPFGTILTQIKEANCGRLLNILPPERSAIAGLPEMRGAFGHNKRSRRVTENAYGWRGPSEG